MREILFPGLNLKFNINKIAFNIFDIDIYWYAIFIVISFIISLFFCKKDDGKYNIKFDNILELSILVIPISIICARLYFILFKLDYYIRNPIQILNLRNGGLAIYGGIIGGGITSYIYCKVKKINLLNLLDYIVVYLPLGQAIGRFGNFFNIEAYGYETDIFLRMGIIENGKYIEVHPTFLYELICNIFIFSFLYYLRNKRKYEGQMLYYYLAFYSFIRIIIEGFRADSLMLGMLKISQILSIVLFIISTSIIIYKRRVCKNNIM